MNQNRLFITLERKKPREINLFLVVAIKGAAMVEVDGHTRVFPGDLPYG